MSKHLLAYSSTQTSESVANFFIRKAIDQGPNLHPLKLMKLVVFAHCMHLVINQVPLIDEAVKKGKYGPELLRLKGKLVDSKGLLSPLEGYGMYSSETLERIWGIYKDVDHEEFASIVNNWFSKIRYIVPGFYWTNEHLLKGFSEIVESEEC